MRSDLLKYTFLPLPMPRDSLLKPLYVVVFFGLFLLYLTAYSYLRSDLRGADRPECRVVYMYPSYARIKSFDESHTKYASKFSLYLYREQGLDSIPADEKEGFKTLDGIPALFIPGNAGSYRQARSIAAEVSNLYFDANINVVDNPNMKNYDFFGADFNEDYTAFHGRTLVDQAEYLNEAIGFILLLYSNNPNPPTSVLILAHSMGGIVARVLPTLPNYIPGSINTIMTLSSPHSAAPLTFDGDILKVYLAVDRFWHEAFNSPSSLVPGIAYERLHNVSLISITGGALDSILPADYTTLGFLVPPTNGFTVFTSGIPDVWTPMDHLAIVWCRQLRRLILKILLEIADVTSPHRTYPLEKRMAIMKKHLLTGFEPYAKNDSLLNPSANSPEFTIKFDRDNSATVENTYKSDKSSGDLFHIFSFASTTQPVFQLVTGTELEFNPHEIFSSLSLLLCRDHVTSSDSTAETIDISTKEEVQSLTCRDYSHKLNSIPRSDPHVHSLLDSSFDGEASPFHALRLDPEDLVEYNLALLIRGNLDPQSFIVAQLTSLDATSIKIKDSLPSLAIRGANITIPRSRSMAINLDFQGAWSSLLSYRLTYDGLGNSHGDFFEPFIRQWKVSPFETKWHVNIRENSQLYITIHGIAPFTPFDKNLDSEGVNLEFWLDPSGDMREEKEDTPIHVLLTVDWLQSLRLLVLRYRLAVVSQCLAVSLAVFIIQILAFQGTGRFPDFFHGLLKLCEKRIIIPLFLFLIVLTPLTKIRGVQLFLDMIDPVVLQDPNEINLSMHHDFDFNSFFLGLEETGLSFLGCLFLLMAIAINFVLFYLLSLVQSGIKYAGHLIFRLKGPAQIEKKSTNPPVARKLLLATMVLVLVPIYLPYQFAFVISLFIQAITTIKLLLSGELKHAWNYHMSVLIMMLWVLPISIPILIVFVHNLNIKWSTPFSSHHNFLAVAPILAMTELHNFFPTTLPWVGDNVEGKPSTDKMRYKVTIGLLVYTSLYCVVYGIRHAFWLHHLFNFWCCWSTLMLGQAITLPKGVKKQ